MLRNYLTLVGVLAVLALMFRVPQEETARTPQRAEASQHAPSSDASPMGEEQPLVAAAPAATGTYEQQATNSGGEVTLQRQSDGHFYADTQINGATVHMLVDTGASAIALTRADAQRAGIGVSDYMPNVVGQGAGGEVRGEVVSLDNVTLGPMTVQNIPAAVLDGGRQSLLGQTFLSQFDSVEIRGDTMVLR